MPIVDHDVGAVRTLEAFLDAEERALPRDGFGPPEMARFVEEARRVLGSVYVHGPLKRATEAYDVDRALLAVGAQVDRDAARIAAGGDGAGDEWRFHQAMLRALGRLRDFHTRYVLPERYRRTAAFLPFLVERAGGEHVVTKVNRHYAAGRTPGFAPGATVLDWNGVPIARAVELVGEGTSGASPDARLARGLEALTIRPLDMTPPPDERWVIVGYRAPNGGTRREARFTWQVLELPQEPDAIDPEAWQRPARILGIDPQAERIRRVKRRVLVPEAPAGRDSLWSLTTVPTPHGDVGYLRIYSFDCADETAFVRAIARGLDGLAAERLVVDVRGNGGGNIVAAEAVLALLSPRPVDREGLQFLATPYTRALSDEPWTSAIAEAGTVGEAYSTAHPLAGEDEWAELTALGQRFQGPRALLVDALSYSATDMFAAGWQDNRLGPVLGTDPRTGAGGANVWSYRIVRSALRRGAAAEPIPPRLGALPGGASLRVAVRRSLRVGARAGVLLEGAGVVPDHLVAVTRRDALGDAAGRANVDLVAAAAERLAGRPVPVLRARRLSGGRLRLTVRGLDLVVVAGDDAERQSVPVDGDALTVTAPAGAVRLEGYAAGRLVASRQVPAPRAPAAG